SRRTTSPRFGAGTLRQPAKALRADSIQRSRSPGDACATRPSSEPSIGERFSKTSPAPPQAPQKAPALTSRRDSPRRGKIRDATGETVLAEDFGMAERLTTN